MSINFNLRKISQQAMIKIYEKAKRFHLFKILELLHINRITKF